MKTQEAKLVDTAFRATIKTDLATHTNHVVLDYRLTVECTCGELVDLRPARGRICPGCDTAWIVREMDLIDHEAELKEDEPTISIEKAADAAEADGGMTDESG